MKTSYTDIPVHFRLQDTEFHVLHIVFERFNKVIPAHSHGKNCFEIHYIPYGQGKAMISGSSYILTPGTLYVTGPGIVHEQTPDVSNAMAEYCVYFKLAPTADKNAGRSISSIFMQTPFWFGKDTQNVHSIMQSLFVEMDKKQIGYIPKVTALLTELVVALVRCYCGDVRPLSSSGDSAATDAAESKQLIAEECFLYEYSSLSLELLARRLGLSIRQTERFLRQTYGKTFQQKKKEAKLSAACSLLKTGNLSVTEIADRLGYSSVEHFSHAFSSHFGISASKYRQENRE